MKRLVACVVALALLPAVAYADGDPASDVLLQQDSFLPYAPPTSAKLKAAVKKLLKDAKAAGYPMKVALINTEADLGAYPNLFNKPQDYANLLNRELASLNPHGSDPQKDIHLLVVMPGGFGGANLGDGVDKALAPVKVKADSGSDGLAQAALAAVARIASANGHELAVPAAASAAVGKSKAKSGGGGSSALIFLAPAVLLFGGLFIAGRRAGRRADS